ncbi:conserved hypothetical protein [Alphaproteobacteria bacterium]
MTYFCCKEMQEFIEDPRDPIRYKPTFREYYIYIHNSNNIITMEYCPWCGKKLPRILRVDYFDVLEREYGLDLALDEIKNNPKIPEEFRTDEWWKNRGL